MNAVYLRARHHLHLLQGADQLFAAVVQAIDRSHTEVRLETYIYAFDRQGEPLAFTVFPVNPRSSFAVDLVFLDDGGARVQTLAVGGIAVTPPGGYALPVKALGQVRWNISAASATPVSSTARTYMPGISRPSGLGTSARRVTAPVPRLTVTPLNCSRPAWG